MTLFLISLKSSVPSTRKSTVISQGLVRSESVCVYTEFVLAHMIHICLFMLLNHIFWHLFIDISLCTRQKCKNIIETLTYVMPMSLWIKWFYHTWSRLSPVFIRYIHPTPCKATPTASARRCNRSPVTEEGSTPSA